MPRPKKRNDQLKDRLLAESIALLEAEGPSAITARRVASVADTSTASVYELFGNKSGLVRTIFYEGFGQLAERIDSLQPAGGTTADLIAAFETSRGFALEYPMLFEVMYARPFAEFLPGPDDAVVALRIYNAVVGRVAAALGLAADSQLVVDAAHVLVALDRGLIASELAGSLGSTSEAANRRRSVAFDATIAGLLEMAESQP